MTEVKKKRGRKPKSEKQDVQDEHSECPCPHEEQADQVDSDDAAPENRVKDDRRSLRKFDKFRNR